MGFIELIQKIFEILVGLLGGILVTNSVTFSTPTVVSNNNAKLTGSGKEYTVNKSSTKVSTPFTVKGYKSFEWYTSNASTGNFESQSTCKNVTSGTKYTDYTLTVSSSNRVARQGKVRVYTAENCTGDYKDYTTAKISYKAGTEDDLCTFNNGGVEYSGACDKSSGAYKNIGTQGPKTCNCYTKAYALAITNNTIKQPPNTNGMDSNKANQEALKCWKSDWAGDYYTSDDREWYSTTSDTFDAIRNELKNNKRPVMVLVSTKNGPSSTSAGTHFLLVTAIKTDSLNKPKSNLSYGDFYIIDPLFNGTANVSQPPAEKNWATRNSEKGGKYGTLLKKELTSGQEKYEIAKYNL